MFWWITLGVVTLLAILPLGIRVLYDEDGPVVKILVGPVKITVFPRPRKEKKPKQEKTKKAAEKQPEQEAKPSESPESQESPEITRLPEPPQPPPQPKPAKKETGGSLRDFLPFVKLALDFLGDLRRKLRMKELYLRLILAGDDPCDLAVNYGKTWTAVGNFLPLLDRWFVIKKKDVEVACDFTASETKVIARAEITITLGRLLALAAVYGCRGLKEFIVFRNKRKGGAVK